MIHPLVTLALIALPTSPLPQEVHALERATGWRALFDGETTAGWLGYGTELFPTAGWDVADGCLHKLPGVAGGDLVTVELFTDFELRFDWRVAPGANSGMKYRVAPSDSPRGMLGPEYQVLDDSAHAQEDPKHLSGSLYALFPAEGAELAPVGDFNTSRVVARGDHIEHWLNGVRVVSCDVGSDAWNAAKAASKFRDAADFAAPRPGHIGFQDHGGEVWYRDVRVRALPPSSEALALIADSTLTGWVEAGDAKWTPTEDGVIGETGGGGQSFLVSEAEYGDFVLELDLRPELPGNSGLQIRSHRKENGRVFGYQIEVDSSPRAWSGGLYDEARRGWLDDLKDEPAARAAFVVGGWNHYRVECVGPWIRTWVNGVPAADAFDPLDLSGVIALQVHSGQNTKVHWRGLRLWDLGTRVWEAVPEPSAAHAWRMGSQAPIHEEAGWLLESGGDGAPCRLALPESLADFALRVAFEATPEARLRVAFRSEDLSPPALGPGLQVAEQAWVCELAQPDATQPTAGTLTICAFGERAAVHLDGKRLSDRTTPGAPREGLVVFEVSGPAGSAVRLSSIELLSEAR